MGNRVLVGCSETDGEAARAGRCVYLARVGCCCGCWNELFFFTVILLLLYVFVFHYRYSEVIPIPLLVLWFFLLLLLWFIDTAETNKRPLPLRRLLKRARACLPSDRHYVVLASSSCLCKLHASRLGLVVTNEGAKGGDGWQCKGDCSVQHGMGGGQFRE